MTSVVSDRHVVQASVLLAFVLTGGLMLGCRDRGSEQPSPATTAPEDTPATSGVTSPVQESLPEPERTPGEAKKSRVETEPSPGETKESPAESAKAPAEAKESPTESERAPAETKEPPAGGEKAPGESEKKSPGEAAPAGGAPGGTGTAADKFDPAGVPTVAWLPEPVGVPESKAEKEADMKQYTERISGVDVTFDMVPIRGGKFKMGSPDDEADRKQDEGPQHEVAIEPFWMGKCEVTWDEYELWGVGLDEQRRNILGVKSTELDTLADAITQPTKPYSDMTFGMGKSGYPAICMTQLAARMYCKWLSAKTGRFYRLPTEAEWEYACRAGTAAAYSFGADRGELDQYAWYFDNSDDKYHKVGQKKPNPWGLHDMHGNVSEWVLDQYVPDYYQQFAGHNTTRPLAVPTTEYSRAARGGCWDDDPDKLRSAARLASTKDWKMQDPQIPQSIWYNTESYCPGFRVVRPLHVPDVEEARLYEPDYKAVKEYQEAQAGKQ